MYIREKIIRKTGLTVLAVFYILFTTGCSGDDDDKKKIRLMRMVTEGMYVLCQGDKSSGAKGCISYIDPKGWSVTRVPLSGKQPRDIVLVEDYLSDLRSLRSVLVHHILDDLLCSFLVLDLESLVELSVCRL